MSYTKTIWEDRTEDQEGTILSADKMNNIENGISNILNKLNTHIEQASSSGSLTEEQIANINSIPNLATKAELNTAIEAIGLVLESKVDKAALMKSKTFYVSAEDWVTKGDIYEYTLSHNGNLDVNEVDVNFYSENNDSQILTYSYIDKGSIKIISDEPVAIKVAIRVNGNNTEENIRLVELESENTELKRTLNKLLGLLV